MAISTLFAFALTFFVFAACPGPDNFTIFTRTISGGLRAGFAYGLGTVTGILVFLTLGVAGLSYAADALAPFMATIRVAGALYLVWMGLSLWFSKPAATPNGDRLAPSRASLGRTYLTGVALNLGNPKMPLFYLAILPNVAGRNLGLGGDFELVAVILMVEMIVIGSYAGLAVKARALAGGATFMRRLNRAAGSVMAATGVTILSSR
jgi:threonine/homoserine/homoserine lactone efflux protein